MKIIAVTGARSEFDLLSSLYTKLNEDSFFDLRLVVTGAHLSETYGKTIANIESTGLKIVDKIYNLIDSDEKIGRVISLGHQIPALAQTFEREKPDLVLVAGDREEAISTSITAAYMDIPVAHFFGGDIAKDGNIDNSTRYATSKFAHLHFVIMDEHKETLIKLGENPDRIFVVGNPAIDNLFTTPNMSVEELSSSIGFNIASNPYLILIKHPIITETGEQADQMEVILSAIIESGVNCLINYPNSDAGNREIISVIEKHIRKNGQFFPFKNLERSVYVNLMKHSIGLIGNSSSGILEAPALGLPAINIGSRQRGRAHSNNVLFVDHDKTQIVQAIRKITHDQEWLKKVKETKSPFGNGNSSDQIVSILKTTIFDEDLIYKSITY